MDLTIIKRDGRRESYKREKIVNGLTRALEKRPISEEEFKKLISNIERDIQLKKKTEIKSSDIGEFIMKNLKKVDQVAYIRFASVYRSFADAASFRKELNALIKKKVKSSTNKTRNKK